jgi:hypothetical protein
VAELYRLSAPVCANASSFPRRHAAGSRRAARRCRRAEDPGAEHDRRRYGSTTIFCQHSITIAVSSAAAAAVRLGNLIASTPSSPAGARPRGYARRGREVCFRLSKLYVRSTSRCGYRGLLLFFGG